MRVLTFGDSFTHCDYVSDEETWQAQLQHLRGDVEAVNFGVPAFGTDQAFLRWRRESAKLDSTVSLLSIWPEDICRNLGLDGFYLTPMGASRAKPRFVSTDGRLRVIGQPCMTPEQRRVAIADRCASNCCVPTTGCAPTRSSGAPGITCGPCVCLPPR